MSYRDFGLLCDTLINRIRSVQDHINHSDVDSSDIVQAMDNINIHRMIDDFDELNSILVHGPDASDVIYISQMENYEKLRTQFALLLCLQSSTVV